MKIDYIRNTSHEEIHTSDPVKGYKGFYENDNGELVCLDTVYKIPSIVSLPINPVLCKEGIHFCQDIRDVLGYYPPYKGKLHVSEVVAIGDTIIGYDKCVTNRIVIVKEVDIKLELNEYNIGYDNLGYHNIGDDNLGSINKGSSNKGSGNIGNHNTGNNNIGNNNVGDYNIGHTNYGDENRGCVNKGNKNLGKFNSGNINIGDYNNGQFNIGDFNKGTLHVGCFNTGVGTFYMFNKPTDWTSINWMYSPACRVLEDMPCKFPPKMFATIDQNDAKKRQEWFDSLSYKDKKDILSLPNFDREIFKSITGIDVGDLNIE